MVNSPSATHCPIGSAHVVGQPSVAVMVCVGLNTQDSVVTTVTKVGAGGDGDVALATATHAARERMLDFIFVVRVGFSGCGRTMGAVGLECV